ncbi:hypothetical protein Tco_0938242 [Tanacetum coccineum]|uniref:Uncharacterized protein n=1 Tax=Tanacetum coccineum TaxID=301880 RepID=A0ABQ5DHH7_9ASTR
MWGLRGEIQLAVIKGSLAVIAFNGFRILVREEYNNVSSWSKLEGKEISIEDFESYNPETGVRTRTRSSSKDSSETIEMDMCVESLELLANEA